MFRFMIDCGVSIYILKQTDLCMCLHYPITIDINIRKLLVDSGEFISKIEDMIHIFQPDSSIQIIFSNNKLRCNAF